MLISHWCPILGTNVFCCLLGSTAQLDGIDIYWVSLKIGMSEYSAFYIFTFIILDKGNSFLYSFINYNHFNLQTACFFHPRDSWQIRHQHNPR